MNVTRILGAFAALLLSAAPLVAQTADQPSQKDRDQAEKQMKKAEEMMRQAEQQMREAEQQMRQAAARLGQLEADKERQRVERKLVIFGDRARLGLVLKSDANPKTDTIGAYVEGLTPGGPAEEAGLQPGDIIVKFNGQALTGSNAQASEDESAPTMKLLELARNLKDGDKVTLEYRRGSQSHTVTVTATRAMGPFFRMLAVPEVPVVPEVPDIDMHDLGDIDVDIHTLARPWRDLELVALNPELGEYFGTTEGILVVSTPKETPLTLRAGDVILKIGDRTPASPEQAIRILRSYEPGESVSLQVMRKREKLALSVQMPASRSGHFYPHHTSPEAPQPPSAPAPPEPPEPRP
jgi:C-terminal processing protease CtpA/Prc